MEIGIFLSCQITSFLLPLLWVRGLILPLIKCIWDSTPLGL